MDLFPQITAVAVVLALLGAVLLLLQRGGHVQWRQAGTPRRLRSVERLGLSDKHALYLVEVDGRFLLIGTSPANCSLLEECGLVEKGVP